MVYFFRLISESLNEIISDIETTGGQNLFHGQSELKPIKVSETLNSAEEILKSLGVDDSNFGGFDVFDGAEYLKVLKYWRSKKISTRSELEAAINGKIIALAYHSGKIENDAITYYDTREIFEHDRVVRYTGDLRTLFEIRNAKDAFYEMLAAFEASLPLDARLLLALHEQLTKNTYDQARWDAGERPGTFKKNDYVVGRDEVGAAPDDVEIELEELLTEINDFDGDDVLKAAAYFHVKFEYIHPFSDGNGRVGRLALNYFLLTRDHPPIIIHEEDRNWYYTALEAWDRRLTIEPMVSFLTEQAVKTWSKNI